MTNIFTGTGIQAKLAGILYELLMTRKDVSYEDVLIKYRPNRYSVNYFLTQPITKDKNYGMLKKAFFTVKNALNKKEPGCIIDNGKKVRGKTFRYTGQSDDPFAEERQAQNRKTLQDYVTFCKETSGILPQDWFSHFFEHTQLLLETKTSNARGDIHIQSSANQELRGIERLPVLYEHISNHHVLKFTYHPYGKNTKDVTIHPHYLKEYNGRWFLFGYLDKSNTVTNFALDRIETDPQVTDDVEYIPAPTDTYKTYFDNIVGVSHEKEYPEVEHVVIRTQSVYIHELMRSKRLHHSQKESKTFGLHEDGQYGEYTLDVEPNRELKGKILTYGEELRVIEPVSLVNDIANTVKELYAFYNFEQNG